MASAALVLALVPLQRFQIDLKIFQFKCPLQNENAISLSKMKFQVWDMLDVFFKTAIDFGLINYNSLELRRKNKDDYIL